VPAGTYKDVVHVSLKLSKAMTMDVWLAPKVGPVKWQTEDAGVKTILELKEFTEGK
jgi:hypothetical protein